MCTGVVFCTHFYVSGAWGWSYWNRNCEKHSTQIVMESESSSKYNEEISLIILIK